MKIILTVLMSVFCFFSVQASDIVMYGKEQYGFNQPKYKDSYKELDSRNVFKIVALADGDNFPISSEEQGSIFNKIFVDLEDATGIQIHLNYKTRNYDETVASFERGNLLNLDDVRARFAVSYEEYPYSKNSYVYPAFFENKIHLLMPASKKLNIQGKESLKDYKGVYVKSDKFPKHIIKDFASLNMEECNTYDEAFEKLLTGKIDYVAANYYTSIIELYKKGLRNFVVYSKMPVWTVSLFLRAHPRLLQDKRMNDLRRYFKSSRYKKAKEDAFEELIEIYKKNTRGILPPKYIGYDKNSKNDEIDDDEE